MNDEISDWLASRVDDTPAPMLEDGAVVGEFAIVGFLGRGGSGEVYRGAHRRLKTPVAVKILHRGDAAGRARFEREAALLANHPYRGFPRFFAYGEADGRPYLVTELLEERPLPSNTRDVASFIQKIGAAVGELHALGFVHRDIKPSNILWRAPSEPVLIDLGLAKSVDHVSHPALGTLSVESGRAVGVGTPGYAAPEQFTGGAVGVSADIHALGVLANACFGGNPPKEWAYIIDRATSSIAGRRFGSVEAMCAAIAAATVGRFMFRSALAVGFVPAAACLVWLVVVGMAPLMSAAYRAAVCGTSSLGQELMVVAAGVALTGVIPAGLLRMKKWAMRLAMVVGAFFTVLLLILPCADAEHGYASFASSAKMVLFFWFVPRSLLFLILLFPRVRAVFSR